VSFAQRFWPDGTPRLTAYEYQGYLLSEEHHNSELTCTSCHNAHGGDPAGMIDPIMRGNEGCLQCHEDIRADVAAHTKHAAEGSGSDCYTCHMPDITYGLLKIHPTHHIENPNPAKAWRYDMPEGCTLCHTNQAAVWAAETQAELFGTQLSAPLPGDPAFATAESQLWAVPFLLLAMEDNNPAIHFIVGRGLRDVTGRTNLVLPLYDFDYLADTKARRSDLQLLQTWWWALDKSEIPFPGTAVPLTPQFELDRTLIDPLLARRSYDQINIGE
jgi:predicted CXXCH cytochrome family protein